MVSDTSITKRRRQMRRSKQGRRRKKRQQNQGTTPQFPVHPDEHQRKR